MKRLLPHLAAIGAAAAAFALAPAPAAAQDQPGDKVQVLDVFGDDPELADMIERFRDDERAHRDAALAAGAERAPAYPLLSAAIRLGCRAAIRLSERI